MRKLMLLAAMLAMALVAAAPTAFAQNQYNGAQCTNIAAQNGDNIAVNDSDQYAANVISVDTNGDGQNDTTVNVDGDGDGRDDGDVDVDVDNDGDVDEFDANATIDQNSDQTAVAVGPQAVQDCNQDLSNWWGWF